MAWLSLAARRLFGGDCSIINSTWVRRVPGGARTRGNAPPAGTEVAEAVRTRGDSGLQCGGRDALAPNAAIHVNTMGGLTTTATTRGLSWRIVATVMMGTLLNPLNSSMISVALVGAATDLHVDIPSATWLVSSFYLVGAIGMPLAGRLADLYGPRRVFRAGLLVVLVGSILAALAPDFRWLLVWRLVQAIGSTAGSPAGQATFRAETGSSRPPTQALGAIAIANNASAAFGPVIGGVAVSLLGWPGIFWINVPVTIVGLGMAWRWLPPDRYSSPEGRPTVAAVVRDLDVPGVILFALAVLGLLAFLLSVGRGPDWPLLGVACVGSILLFVRELRQSQPFFDVRFLAHNPRLVHVYLQFAAVSLIFYGAFFGLPQWLQQVRHLEPAAVGLIVLPISGMAVLLTPLAARLIRLRGLRPALLIGASVLLAGELLQLTLGSSMPIVLVLGVTAVIGVASAFNNLGLQAALYEFAPAEWMGTATGQFQTFRYIGATLSTALLGLVYVGAATTEGCTRWRSRYYRLLRCWYWPAHGHPASKRKLQTRTVFLSASPRAMSFRFHLHFHFPFPD
jgi:MFS family permease